MEKKLSLGNIMSLSLMLFAMFFGAGNMIFPPMIGNLGGTSYLWGIIGFMTTDAGLSILGISSIVLLGSQFEDLGNLVGKKFSAIMGMLMFLLIGPLFALPRTATVSYSIGFTPFIDQLGLSTSIPFTLGFFLVTYLLCINPSKIVDIIGKVLTPLLLATIFLLYITCLINPMGNVVAPKADYVSHPFFHGFLSGYLSMDGLASLVLALIVINGVKAMGITKPKSIVKYTVIAGVIAAISLGVVYYALSYIGAQTSALQTFDDGGQLLAYVANYQLGTTGIVILAIAVFLACLTTAMGIATAFSDYIITLKPNWSYRVVLASVLAFSFVVSNLGLKEMIKVTLPMLYAIYPPIIALVILSFFKKYIGTKREPYFLCVLAAGIIGIVTGLKEANLDLGYVDAILSYIPLYKVGIGWLIPSFVGVLIGILPCVKFLKPENKEEALCCSQLKTN